MAGEDFHQQTRLGSAADYSNTHIEILSRRSFPLHICQDRKQGLYVLNMKALILPTQKIVHSSCRCPRAVRELDRGVPFAACSACASLHQPRIITRVAESVKNAIKAYEQTTSLPYDSVPTEVCRARDGTRSIDLAAWSLLVDDVALRYIAAGDRERIDELAAQSSVNKVRQRHNI